ncbi:Mevalonate/galactokinase family protein isoform 1 [Hibiscus syriacus]|uniref:Mevalonate/galactokinase family protein isoform 1 n=1 Tax=Hibiscus syriacus TaxID=106335 RepID=A0A6A3BB03_HIBSY|nr:Werner Syndrome-like exonuclease [Hibiscus syriacus]KAE8714240.1 Mevalonate/galactokinase family protein isoform 1 [Hibiscus syriacus]
MNDDYITISSHFNPNPNSFRTFTVTFFSTPITTTVTATPSVVRDWLHRVLRIHSSRRDKLVVGLGVQWNPFSSVHSPPAATLQLCIGRQCLIFQLLYANAVPLSLRRFLVDPRNTFVGVWNLFDAAKLYWSNHRIWTSRLVDAHDFAAKRRGLRRELSMEKLAQIILGTGGVKKPKTIGCSAWDTYRLSVEQVQYACVDAYVSFELGKALEVWDWDEYEGY